MAQIGELIPIARDVCKKEDIVLTKAILLVGEVGHISIDAILVALSDVIDSVKSAVRVGRQPHRPSPATALVVELEVEATHVMSHSQDIHLDIYGALMPFHLTSLSEPGQSSSNRVTLVEAKRKIGTRDSTPSFVTLNPPNHRPPHQENTLAESLARVSLRSNYRKVRPFSGCPAKDEDSFDVWVEQVEGQMEEWTAAGLDDVEKRRRVSEALRAPASTIARDVKVSKIQATAEDYIAALEVAFGTTESGEEILLKFHDLHQADQEKPSDFLLRINTTLRRVLRKGGVDRSRADHLRLQKFIRSLYDEMFLVSLRLRDRLEDPPSFISLLSMVRRYEEEISQKRLRKPVKGRSLQAFASGMAEPSNLPPQNTLEERLTRMEELMLRPASNTLPAPAVHTQALQFRASGEQDTVLFCYKCGRDGHFRSRCPNEANLEAVNQKLIKSLHNKSGNAIGHQRRSNPGPISNQAPTPSNQSLQARPQPNLTLQPLMSLRD